MTEREMFEASFQRPIELSLNGDITKARPGPSTLR